jgi:isopenicillin N synthase-like dioxygenase
MKKRTIKTEKVLAAYRLLGSAKYTKLADEDKIKVLKICIALKPVATKYDEDSKDVAEKLKPSEDYDERLAMAQDYDRASRDKDADMSAVKMGPAEFNEFIKEMNHYQDLISKALQDEMEKEVEVEFESISEDALLKLMNSNDWTMAAAMAVSEVAMED